MILVTDWQDYWSWDEIYQEEFRLFKGCSPTHTLIRLLFDTFTTHSLGTFTITMNWISPRLFVICRKQPTITALFTFMLFTSEVYILVLFKYNSFNSTSLLFQHLQSIHSKTCDTLSVTETPLINTFLWAPCGIDIFTSKLATNDLCTCRHQVPRRTSRSMLSYQEST